MGALPEKKLNLFMADMKKALGEDLLSISLYGSAGSGDYVEGRSDVNFLIVVKNTAPLPEARLIPLMDEWQKKGVATPLVMTPEYIETSRGVFPIEFMIMARSLRVLSGEGPLSGTEPDEADLKAQLRREFKAKLAALSLGLLQSRGERDALLNLIRQSAPAFTALFKAYLRVTGGDFPDDARDVMEQAAARGLSLEGFTALIEIARNDKAPQAAEILEVMSRVRDELAAMCRLSENL